MRGSTTLSHEMRRNGTMEKQFSFRSAYLSFPCPCHPALQLHERRV